MRATWCRVKAPIEYDMAFPSLADPERQQPSRGVILPGRVGQSYLTMAVGSDRLSDLMNRGIVECEHATYEAPPEIRLSLNYRWPEGTVWADDSLDTR